MTADASLRVGWCPGALRPMAAGDGLILRVKPRGATLDLAAVTALARLASAHGNGEIDLTSRANLQIRGVQEHDLAAVLDALAGLRLLDADAEREAIRNLVVNPLAGLTGGFDIRPLVRTLEHMLATEADLRALPAKWSMVVDDDGPLPLTDVQADLRFEATIDGFAVGLAQDTARARCPPDRIVAISAALCRQAAMTGERMADLVARRGVANVFAGAGLEPFGLREPSGAPTRPPRNQRGTTDIVGPWHHEGRPMFGAAAPFGILNARDLLRFAEAVATDGATELRLTPWRILLAPLSRDSSGPAMEQALAMTNLVVDRRDPRLSIAACIGAPECHRGTTPVRADAAALAAEGFDLQTSGVAVHVSGCAKGCAHAAAAPWTLVGREGRYDVVRHGRAGDIPLRRGLSFQEAADWISRSPDERRV